MSPRNDMRPTIHSGFTLIEFLIYIAIAGGLLLSASSVMFNVLNYKLKLQAIEEVSQNSRNALDRMELAIENASAILSPVVGATSSLLMLSTADTSTNPTIFAASNHVLQMKEGVSATSSLTADESQVVNIVFTNLTATGSLGTVRIDLTVSSTNPTNNTQNAYSLHDVTSVSIRKH